MQRALDMKEMLYSLTLPSNHADIVLCAGSDKSIEALDMNVGKTAARIPDVQSRAVHAIAQNQVRNDLLVEGYRA